MKFFQLSVRLSKSHVRLYPFDKPINSLYFRSFFCFCFVRAFSFRDHTKIALYSTTFRTVKLVLYFVLLDDDLADPAVCSSLTSLEIRHASKDTINCILCWAFPDIEPSRNLTSLNLSYSQSSRVFQFFSKFPALKKLDLTGFRFTKNMSVEAFRYLKNLEWLELKGCNRISGKEISELSESVGRTLRYLGLADLLLHPLITDNHLRDLASMFPVLRTLDLSGCVTITDALLVEWYVKNEQTSWPKLRKLVLKNCGVSQEVVNLVRLKTKNHLLVEL